MAFSKVLLKFDRSYSLNRSTSEISLETACIRIGGNILVKLLISKFLYKNNLNCYQRIKLNINMEINIIRTISQFSALKKRWELLEQQAPQVSYFSSFRYNFDWWKAHESDASLDLFIVTAIQNNEIVGIAPLQIKTNYWIRNVKGLNVRILQFIHGGGDYSNFIVHPNSSAEPAKIVSELISAIEKHCAEYDEINLTHIDQYSLLAHQLLVSKHNQQLQYLIECPYIDFSHYPDYEDYTRAYCPKKIKQYINRLGREVDYQMVVTSDNIVDRLAEVHVAEKRFLISQGRTQRHSKVFEDSCELTFRKQLYLNNNNVLTYMLVDACNDAIICYYTGYVKDNIFHSATTAYHPDYARLAVGKIFNYMIFAENYQRPRWRIFDMGTGRYAWKFEMTYSFNLLYQWNEICSTDKIKNRRIRINRFIECLKLAARSLIETVNYSFKD